MNKPLKLIRIGNSTGVILPREVLAHLKVAQGEELSVTSTAGGIELRRCEADFEEQMRVAREVMARRRAALHELAK
ncbi:AbrB/MazE/SpoVT family DNA-binding domain-containing protein [Sphingomonas sp.]|uniref:AbrB/MazE/SpoVT family DNA-binding domain-containing protein n=1 Tax=Sphingomonas sp. TaxID=28214 RepID=UPI001E01A460|nr:AbrB/MazE/SpoVT family DNA-binding domain-containing protein [Sphingomonas sp.]MBX9795947.1 AbrB/MazE/SpoVT family DNA-binding domain-containing protein [Sphingomonas sp.]